MYLLYDQYTYIHTSTYTYIYIFYTPLYPLIFLNHHIIIILIIFRQKWPGPRQYEVRYNRKRVHNFSRLRCLKMVFKPWREFFSLQWKIKQAYQRTVGRFLKNHFLALRTLCSTQHKLRSWTIDNWKSYSR